ncbi:MAG: hypothetical protein WCD68_18260, partial [Candidatus Acidiferrum sp.]
MPRKKRSPRKSVAEVIKERVAEMMLRRPHNSIPITGPDGNRKLVKERLLGWEDGNDSSVPEPGIFKFNRSQLNGQTPNAP